VNRQTGFVVWLTQSTPLFGMAMLITGQPEAIAST